MFSRQNPKTSQLGPYGKFIFLTEVVFRYLTSRGIQESRLSTNPEVLLYSSTTECILNIFLRAENNFYSQDFILFWSVLLDADKTNPSQVES